MRVAKLALLALAGGVASAKPHGRRQNDISTILGQTPPPPSSEPTTATMITSEQATSSPSTTTLSSGNIPTSPTTTEPTTTTAASSSESLPSVSSSPTPSTTAGLASVVMSSAINASTSYASTTAASSASMNATLPMNSTTTYVSANSTSTAAASGNSTSAAGSANSTSSATASAASASASAACDFCEPAPGYDDIFVPAPLFPHYAHISSKWRAAHAKAASYLDGWTVDELVLVVTGVGWENGRCVGNTPAIPSHGYPGLCLEDSPLGVRDTDYVTAFPAAINAAATFDKSLIRKRAKAMGQEFKGKGVNIALGPMHYFGNEQERNRTTESSNIDDRTQREIYTHPFLRGVQEDAASVMCSYNLINGSWACQNSYSLNKILKEDFGFAGMVMSDWGAQHSGVQSANYGLDLTMPGDTALGSGVSFWGANLTQSVNNGSVSLDRLQDMAQRVIAAWFLLGQDEEYPAVNFDAFRSSDVNNSHVDVQDDHYKIVREIDAASTVLLKNDGVLPLAKVRTLAIIGSDAGPPLSGPNGYSDRGGIDGTLAMGWGSGTDKYLIDPLSAIQAHVIRNHTTVQWSLLDYDYTLAQTTATGADVAMVFIQSDSGEGYITVDNNEGDRNNLSAWHSGDDLVLAVAAVNPNTVVVVHSVGPLIIEPWIEHPNVTAVLWAGIPGQETGNGLVDVLFGAVNPSGRLPYTIARNRSDYSADIVYVDTDVPAEPQVNYTEGLFIDYRHFLQAGIAPRYPFGYGLSYTTFKYTDLCVGEVGGGSEQWKRDDAYAYNVTVGRFLVDSLQKTRWQVNVTVCNTGSVAGHDVPQLYLAFPPAAMEPPRVLRDFERVYLEPGATTTVSYELSRYAVSVWDVVAQDWTVVDGEYGVIVAANAEDSGTEVTYTFK